MFAPLASPLYPYLIGNTPGLRGSPAPPSPYYSSLVTTVLSGFLGTHHGLAATEFFGWGEKSMWRKPEDSKPGSPAAEVPASSPGATQRVEPVVRSVAGLTAEVVQPSGGIITSTILIKGEVHGTDDLYIDGEVQGTIAW